MRKQLHIGGLMNSKVCDGQSRDESPDARLALLRNAIQEGLDSGHAEFFDFDEFVMSKLSQAGENDA